LGLEVVKARALGDDETARLTELGAELAVVVAYGALVREPLLSAFPHGWINLHFSLLPHWRGAAPVQRALMAGETTTGASVFRLVEELDAGDVYATLRHEIDGGQTTADLLGELAVSGAALVAETVAGIADGTARAVPQEGEATYASKLALDDGRVRWEEPAEQVIARHRGVTPEPGSHTTVAGERLKVLAAEPAPDSAPGLEPGALASQRGGVLAGTGDGAILLTRVQPAGKGPMAAADWFRGLRGAVRLGS
ncbi:MAG: methionyl-tRNA formyltransferase, partial [Microbacterium sp.]